VWAEAGDHIDSIEILCLAAKSAGAKSKIQAAPTASFLLVIIGPPPPRLRPPHSGRDHRERQPDGDTEPDRDTHRDEPIAVQRAKESREQTVSTSTRVLLVVTSSVPPSRSLF
jgi:hypothetical protein